MFRSRTDYAEGFDEGLIQNEIPLKKQRKGSYLLTKKTSAMLPFAFAFSRTKGVVDAGDASAELAFYESSISNIRPEYFKNKQLPSSFFIKFATK